MIGHVRGFILMDYASSGSRGVANIALYFATGLGHSAVLAFFALSGFLVGGGALRAILAGTWSAPLYLVARLSRLWTVAIPALAITWIVDVAGMAIAGQAGYDGLYWSILASGPRPEAPASLSLSTFVANLLFLQMIAAPVLGSNGPLWSLANEFWYYVAAPFAAYGVAGRGPRPRHALALALAICLAAALPFELVVLGLIWVAGAFARMATGFASPRRALGQPACVAGLACLLAAVFAFVSLRGAGSLALDIAQGFLWAMILPGLARLPVGERAAGRVYARLAVMLSEVSYTLYAIHFPILAFICFMFLSPDKLRPGAAALGVGAGLVCVVIGAAAATWWLFERNTPRVRRAAIRVLRLENRPAANTGTREPA